MRRLPCYVLTGALLSALVGCPQQNDAPAVEAPPAAAANVPDPPPAAPEPAPAPEPQPDVAAGDYVWQASPFEELTFAEASAHCTSQGRVLLGHQQLLAEHARHRDTLWVAGTYWSSTASQLEAGRGWVVELSVPGDDGMLRTGSTPRPGEERHWVRCARANPSPPAPESAPGSCDTLTGDSQCMQHGAEAFANLSPTSRAGICTSMAGGTYRRQLCPTTDLVGRCARAGGQLKHYYSTGGTPWDEERARANCSGTFEVP